MTRSRNGIDAVLRRKAFVLALFALMDGVVSLATVAGLWTVLGVALSHLAAVNGTVFFLFALAAWALAAVMAYRLVVEIARSLTGRERTAIRLEKRHPDLAGDLLSAVQLTARKEYLSRKYGLSPSMIEGLAQEVAERRPGLGARGIFDRRRMTRDLAVLAVVVPVVVAFAILPAGDFTGVVSVLINPMEANPFAAPYLRVEPGNVTVMAGDSVAVKAVVKGRSYGRLRLEIKESLNAEAEEFPMTSQDPATFAAVMRDLIVSRWYRVVHPRLASPWYEIKVAAVPAVGNINLRLDFPAYTGLPSRETASGEINCYPGTVVRWRGRANKPLAEAELLMSDGLRHLLRIGTDQSLEGEFVVTSGGRYRILIKDKEGFSPRRPDEYGIVLTADENPAVSLTAPAEDMEVDKAEVLEISVAAGDDFGLSRAVLVCRPEGGDESRLPLPAPGGKKSYDTVYSWDMAALDLKPGKRIMLHAEVWDTDSVSGPKMGRSQPRWITIKDDEAVHRDLNEIGRELTEELTDVLADEIDLAAAMDEMRRMEKKEEQRFDKELHQTTSDQARAADKLDKTMEKFAEYLSKLAQDTREDASSLYQKALAGQMFREALDGERAEQRELSELDAMPEMPFEDKLREMGLMSAAKEKRVAAMEQALNLLRQANKYQAMEEAVRAQKDAVDSQQELLDKLEKLKDGLSAKDASELGGMLRDIAHMLGELMKQLTSMTDAFPEEFINADAMKDLPFNDLMKELQAIAEALSRGDLETAKRKAEALLKKMNELLAKLQEAADSYRDMQGKSMEKFEGETDELTKLIEAQRKLLGETEAMATDMKNVFADMRLKAEEILRGRMRLASKALDQKLLPNLTRYPNPYDGRLTLALRLDLDRIRSLAEKPGDVRSAMEEAWNTLKNDLEALAPSVEGAQAAEMSEVMNNVVSPARKDIAEAAVSESLAAGEAEKARLNILSGRQRDLGQRVEKLRKEVAALAGVLPMIPPELAESLGEAAVFMKDAEDKLAAFMPSQASPPEREAIYRLLKSQSAAQGAAQRMSKMAGLRQGGRNGGEAGMLFGLMPGIGGSPNAGQREHGRMGVSVRNFRIPGSHEYEVPRLFREEIMESMKTGYPREYERAIREYFRSITE